MPIAEPHMRLWILLCSDLALRSGAAARLCPEHRDPISGLLAFTTKFGAKLRLPVTKEIEALLRTCDLDSPGNRSTESQCFTGIAWSFFIAVP
ncbi:MAG: hypothetical protein WA354_00900 [Terracidiphilus sp.]